MAPENDDYPNGFGPANLISTGTSGNILHDRNTQTVIKWPTSSRSCVGIQRERVAYEKIKEAKGNDNLLAYCGGVSAKGIRLAYAANGDLRSFIGYRGISSPHTTKWMVQIARALEFIHGLRIIHGNVTLTHMVLDERYNAKLIDFAWAAVGSGQLRARTSASHEFPGDRQSVQGDLFAFGSAMYELVTGHEPFVGLKDGEIRGRFKSGTFPDVASLGKLGVILSSCWKAMNVNASAVVLALEGECREGMLQDVS